MEVSLTVQEDTLEEQLHSTLEHSRRLANVNLRIDQVNESRLVAGSVAVIPPPSQDSG
jgi:hypothetical protein